MNSARANTGETSKFCMDNEKRHAVTNFHTYIISMVRAVRPYFSLHKITFKYNLHTTNKFLDWAKKKMNSNKYHFCTIKRAKYNLSRLRILENTLLILFHKRARHSSSPLLDSHDDKLTYPLTFLQTHIYRAKRTRRNEFSPVSRIGIGIWLASSSFTARGRISNSPSPRMI